MSLEGHQNIGPFQGLRSGVRYPLVGGRGFCLEAEKNLKWEKCL
jgi:hypothetical protein